MTKDEVVQERMRTEILRSLPEPVYDVAGDLIEIITEQLGKPKISTTPSGDEQLEFGSGEKLLILVRSKKTGHLLGTVIPTIMAQTPTCTNPRVLFTGNVAAVRMERASAWTALITIVLNLITLCRLRADLNAKIDFLEAIFYPMCLPSCRGKTDKGPTLVGAVVAGPITILGITVGWWISYTMQQQVTIRCM